MLTQISPACLPPRSATPATAVDPSLVASVVAAGAHPDQVVSDLRLQLGSWTGGLDFVQRQEWRMTSPEESAVWVYEIGTEKGLQRAMFTRRDGDLILDTLDEKFSQRIVMDVHGRVVFNSGKRPRSRVA